VAIWRGLDAVAATEIEVWGCSPSHPFPSPSSFPFPCLIPHVLPSPPISSVTFPFPPPLPLFSLPSPPLPLPPHPSPHPFPSPACREADPLNPARRCGGAVSSPSGVWGRAPAEIEFGAF